VFHVYVDPLFGDNALATQRNPKTNATPPSLKPLDQNPRPGYLVQGACWWYASGVLQHAPYAFKTLTNSTGALEEVRRAIKDATARLSSRR
jgi:hypothetical protein